MQLNDEQAKHVAETLRIIAIAELASLATQVGSCIATGYLWR
jgi:hypothetical protein